MQEETMQEQMNPQDLESQENSTLVNEKPENGTDELSTLQSELREQKDKYLRLVAEKR